MEPAASGENDPGDGDQKLTGRSDRPPTSDEIVRLRRQFYNATLLQRIDIHDDLARFRIRPDSGVPRFEPGQYVAMGVGFWESRVEGSQDELLETKQSWKLVKRAYSISCPMLDENDQLLTCDECDYFEFYVTLIRRADQVPELTPRLFNMKTGDRLFVHPRVVGTYTLEGIHEDDPVVLLATGTGEAPHNAMVARLLRAGHRGRIVVATCARVLADLGYRREHAVLQNLYRNYSYHAYTTREPHNLDRTAHDFVGVERLQNVYRNGRLGHDAGIDFDPATTHVFLCGNPAMIGLRRPHDPPLAEPGMLQLLIDAGFRSLHPVPASSPEPAANPAPNANPAPTGSSESAHHAEPPGPGVIRYEKYW